MLLAMLLVSISGEGEGLGEGGELPGHESSGMPFCLEGVEGHGTLLVRHRTAAPGAACQLHGRNPHGRNPQRQRKLSVYAAAAAAAEFTPTSTSTLLFFSHHCFFLSPRLTPGGLYRKLRCRYADCKPENGMEMAASVLHLFLPVAAFDHLGGVLDRAAHVRLGGAGRIEQIVVLLVEAACWGKGYIREQRR